MESPNKRQRTETKSFDIPVTGRPSTTMQTGSMDAQDDFVSLGGNGNADEQYGYGAANENQQAPHHAPSGPRDNHTPNGHHGRQRNARHDPRNAKDRPKSKHDLPGYEPWILVRTKFGRRFAHNTKTKESFWYIPKDVMPGVIAFERSEKEDKEKADNQKWAEEQLREMEAKSKAAKINKAADAEEGRSRRRRSESLQREDEEAFMAELAAQAEAAEEEDVKEVVQAVEEKPQGPQAGDYASDSEYEYVEVTDTEGEGDEEDDGQEQAQGALLATEGGLEEPQEDGPVEFGEDDIAYQLAAMGEEYGLDPGEYGDDQEGEWEEGAEGLPLTEEDAINLFRDMLDDHRISPYTPWDKLIADESADSILMDDRYTILPTSKARKETWEVWTKDKAAQLREERAKMEKLDPKIPYLAFLSEKATPKLYWPEFKRKFKKDAEMNDRKLLDKDREKLYREHINRLKLPESTRKADLINLLKSQPLSALNKSSTLDSLPQPVLGHLHLISLPSTVREPLIERHIASLPPPPDADEGEWSEEQRAAEEKKRAERRKREAAMAERERQVNEERHRTGRDEAQAKRILREEQAELARYARI